MLGLLAVGLKPSTLALQGIVTGQTHDVGNGLKHKDKDGSKDQVTVDPAQHVTQLHPALVRPYQGWMKLGHMLGWINSHLILGAVFVFVLQPIAYVMRLTGYDPLKRKRAGLESYREQAKHKSVDLTRIF